VQDPARFAIGACRLRQQEIGLALNNPNPMMNGSRAAAFQESEGRVRPIEERRIIAAHLQAECAGGVRGPKPWRASRREVTLFKSPALAAEDPFAAGLAYLHRRDANPAGVN